MGSLCLNKLSKSFRFKVNKETSVDPSACLQVGWVTRPVCLLTFLGCLRVSGLSPYTSLLGFLGIQVCLSISSVSQIHFLLLSISQVCLRSGKMKNGFDYRITRASDQKRCPDKMPGNISLTHDCK